MPQPSTTTPATTSKAIRAAIYARVSTTGHGQDVGLQTEELRRVAEAKGWAIVEFVDAGASGATESRPALDKLMAAVRAGKVDVVLCWRFDRFARSVRHLLDALDEFRSLGVQFVSVKENIDTSSALGKALFTLAAVIAELERELLLERVRAGVARAKAAGTHCGRPRRELDLRAARVLLDQGHSVRSIADMLGIPRGTLRRRLDEAAVPSGSKVAISTTPADAG